MFFTLTEGLSMECNLGRECIAMLSKVHRIPTVTAWPTIFSNEEGQRLVLVYRRASCQKLYKQNVNPLSSLFFIIQRSHALSAFTHSFLHCFNVLFALPPTLFICFQSISPTVCF